MISAHALALAYTQAVCAYWRGDNVFLPQFETWLTRFWADDPVEPATQALALCPHGAGGRGIYWHESGASILGYVPGKRGCFQIPRTAVLPSAARRGQVIALTPVMAA